MNAVERDKALDGALAQIEKQFGKGSVMRMGEKTSMKIGTISTGALALDIALGAFLGGTGIAPGEQAAFLEAQRWLVDTMDAPAVRDEPWADQYTEEGLRLFAERQEYEPYLM